MLHQHLQRDYRTTAAPPPAYVRTLARGTTWMLWGLLVFIVVRGGVQLLAFLPGPHRIATLAGILAPLVLLWGAWRVTTPDPRRTTDEPPLSARRLARIGILATLARLAFILLTVFVLRRFLPRNAPIVAIYGAVIFVGLLFYLAGLVALLVHLRALAIRAGARRLARRTRVVVWGLPIGYSLGIVAFVLGTIFNLMLLMRSTPTGTSRGLLLGATSLAAGLGELALLVFGIWWAVLLGRYRRRFRDAAEGAEGNWMAEIRAAD